MKFSISTLLLLVSFVAMLCGSYKAAGIPGIFLCIFVAGIGLAAFGVIHRSRRQQLAGVLVSLGLAVWFGVPIAVDRWQEMKLLRDLHGPSSDIREAAFTELLDRRVDLNLELLLLLNDPVVSVREFASNALIELRPFDPEVFIPLVIAMSDENAAVRCNSTKAIGKRLKQADPSMTTPDSAAVTKLLMAAKDDVAAVRLAASVAILSLGNRYHEQAVPGFIEAIQSEDSFERSCAINYLGELDPYKRQAMPVLIELLQSETDPVMQVFAATAIGRMGTVGSSAIPNLIELLQKKSDPSLIIAATRAIGSIGPKGAPAVPVLIELLQDVNDRLPRHSATEVNGMGAKGAPTRKPLSFAALRHEGFYSLQIAILHTLGRIGLEAEPALPILTAIRDVKIPAKIKKGTEEYAWFELPTVVAREAIERISRQENRNRQTEQTNTETRREGSIP